jgi:RNA-directed DNA polymerase
MRCWSGPQHTRGWTTRYADDLVIPVDWHRRHDWLLKAVPRRLREELAKLDLRLNADTSRLVDLREGEAFGEVRDSEPGRRQI